MPSQTERRQFARSAPNYRSFLKKFSENPIFDYETISVALAHVYDKVFKRPIPGKSKIRLVNTIILNEQKVLNDLETLKKSPKSVMEPLISSNVSFEKVKTLVTEILDKCVNSGKYHDKNLINKVCKIFGLSSSSENVKNVIKNLKKKYVQQKKDDGQTSKLQFPNKKRKMSKTKLKVPNPIVLLKIDKRLQKMAKNVQITEKKEEGNKFSKDTSEKRCTQHSNENLDIEMHLNLSEKEVEKNNCLQDQNASHKDNLEFIKQEINLNDTNQLISGITAQVESESTESQYINNCNLLTEIEVQSSEITECSNVISNDQENILPMRMGNYNIIPSMQFINNVSFIPNAAIMINSDCNAFIAMPITQFPPNIIMTNNNSINSYQGLYNNTFVLNPVLEAQNFSIIPEQSYCNQGLSPSQEIVKLQTTIEGLRSQINFWGNVLANQMHTDE